MKRWTRLKKLATDLEQYYYYWPATLLLKDNSMVFKKLVHLVDCTPSISPIWTKGLKNTLRNWPKIGLATLKSIINSRNIYLTYHQTSMETPVLIIIKHITSTYMLTKWDADLTYPVSLISITVIQKPRSSITDIKNIYVLILLLRIFYIKKDLTTNFLPLFQIAK